MSTLPNKGSFQNKWQNVIGGIFIGAAIGFVLLLIYIFFNLKHDKLSFFSDKQNSNENSPVNAGNLEDKANQGQAANQGIVQGTVQGAEPQQNAGSSPNNSPNEDDENNAEPKTAFRRWVRSEADQMRIFSGNSAQKENELRQKAANLNEGERLELKNLALNTGSSIDERSLAAYLLSMTNDGVILADLATSPLNVDGVGADGKAPAHSVAEVKLTQERALRMQEINKLAELATTSDENYRRFEKVIVDISDPYLKNYAQNKFKKIKR